MFSNLLISYHALVIPSDSIYEKCKIYLEKYMYIKNVLKHKSNTLQNMKIKNKILSMRNKQLERDLEIVHKILEDKINNNIYLDQEIYIDESSDSDKEYEVICI